MSKKAAVWVVECKHPKRKDDIWEPQTGTRTFESRRLGRGFARCLKLQYPPFIYRVSRYVREEKP